ncbi:SigE family RNA polymerase sigma factor [Dactylosporangium matsuzakiense]|uniref:RNA polymerase sigma24 factor n=1 Tax=Dactylosporangium matsuzakiense TaxID=53360 RepID=A0A9W6KT31_9ACTN|nr:SigE family RNA polymerase sigma factor [Dactylosporangium matsuzakiense]UWZ44755.1 SigE family RNA polymerase sigma factor [Dactylosporangium matsuzakiense]GLL06006.1 RNA polymerase sigma24 factor [Dactylosporangium matsuzakiense]
MGDDDYVEYVTARLPALHRLAYALTGDPHRADDLVQQTITTLYVKWAKVRRVEHPDRYVRSMLVNTFVDERRLAWSRVRLFAEPPERPAPDDYRAERTAVRQALARVPRRQQAVLVLRFFYDLPVAEVAEILGVTPGTVKSQTAHGLTALRKLLGEQSVTALTKER